MGRQLVGLEALTGANVALPVVTCTGNGRACSRRP
jgi:hypothetical protein